MSITAAEVNALRQKTGVSMMACKKALTEANGDEEKAIEILRKKGEAKAVDKSDREAKEGGVAAATGGGKGVVVKVCCETDFVARNEDFVALCQKVADIVLEKGIDAAKPEADAIVTEHVGKLGENMILDEVQEGEGAVIGAYIHSNRKVGAMVFLDGGTEEQAKDVAMHVTASDPKVISPDEVSDELVEKEKEIWKDQLKNEGKPEQIWDKIIAGKESKFRSECALMKQPFVKNPEQTIEQYLGDAKVTKFIRMTV